MLPQREFIARVVVLVILAPLTATCGTSERPQRLAPFRDVAVGDSVREDTAADVPGLDLSARYRVLVWRSDNTADTLPGVLLPGPGVRPSLLGDSLVVGLAAHDYGGPLRLYRYHATERRVEWRDLPASLRGHVWEGEASLAPNGQYIAFFVRGAGSAGTAGSAVPAIADVERGAILRQLPAVALPEGDVERAAASWESPSKWVFFLDPFEGDSSGHWWVRLRGALHDSTFTVDTVSATELMQPSVDSARTPHN